MPEPRPATADEAAEIPLGKKMVIVHAVSPDGEAATDATPEFFAEFLEPHGWTAV